jgi:hypothetical protein
MTHQNLLRGLISGVVLAIVLSASALAKGSRTINLLYAASLSATPIEAGEYQLSWEEGSPEATVTLTKGKNVVATAQGKIEERRVKYERSMVVVTTKPDGSRTISEFRLEGTNKAIVFSE